ncbi:MAG: alpha-keto acid decarboxylase family protein [Gammaproteobacteria bacterium]|nr:alpha-keto acid decarboxylase family protein [Gammaproteobacteria bacterium]
MAAAVRSTGRARSSSRVTAAQTIGGYLIECLIESGVRDVFGIPGDFVLGFYGLLEASPLRVIGTTNEACAGYAADAYARVNGIGAVCVTYCVGGLSLTNAVAGAYAEKSPVVVISGAPGMAERRSDPLLHHRVRDFDTQLEVFGKITIAAVSLADPNSAFREIDRCFDAVRRYKRPVFLELPRDRVNTPAVHPHVRRRENPRSDPQALAEALAETAALIEAARRPVIIAGVEVHRFGLRAEVIALAERLQIPICATLLGKSVVGERHPLYLGVYEGAMGREDVRRAVENADCVLLLGAFMTDINLGIYTANLDPGRCVYATSEQLRIRHHHFHDVLFADFLRGLLKARVRPRVRRALRAKSPPRPWRPKPAAAMTSRRLFRRIDALLDERMVVIADPGDALFGAADLVIHRHTEFISPAYYTSMGFAVPAAIGVQAANRRLRPLVLVGDGAFQMTGQELSTAVKLGFNPIVLVLNNKGYTTERFLQEGPFNDIPNWNYHCLPALLGAGRGFEVRTEGEFEHALGEALASDGAFSILNIHLEPDDVSPALQRLAARLTRRI